MATLSKNDLRKIFKQVLNNLPKERRFIASKNAYRELRELTSKQQLVLSFASMPMEIDIWKLNCYLAKSGKLVLPKMEKENLTLYLTNKIEKTAFLYEPDERRSFKINPSIINCALIPALAFDKNNHRLGHGKGFFDRLLPKLTSAITIGIGFKEQLHKGSFPIAFHDIGLNKVLLF